MKMQRDGKYCEASPLLLRFVRRIAPPDALVRYDYCAQVNMLEGQEIPAVFGDFDLKTIPAAPGED